MSRFNGLRVECVFDCDEFVTANGNILVIRSTAELADEVEIVIKNKKGEVEASTYVSGHDLKKAIDNAMND